MTARCPATYPGPVTLAGHAVRCDLRRGHRDADQTLHGNSFAALGAWRTTSDPDPDALGPCGCTDYHMADCPTRWHDADYWAPEPGDPDYED